VVTGDPGAAAKAFERAAHLGRDAQPAPAALALAELALLAAAQGDWSQAADRAAESRHLVQTAGLHDSLFGLLTYVAGGRIAAHKGDDVTARHDVANALRLYTRPSPAAFSWLAVQADVGLGRVLLDLGERADAGLRAFEGRRHLARLLTEGVLRDELRQLAADIAERDRQGRMFGGITLTAAELRVLQSLRTHLTLGEIARELYISRNTVKTQVAAVYRKLRASTRTEAVRTGRILGLLD
jgi:LuxR family transcriptional regulator, maltose regulon positive regulatory protein